jgi:uncharacterized protein YcbK (DUF882 family)
MGDLSTHFSRREFACKCGCGFDTVDHELIEVLEDLREFLNAPVMIASGCRCFKYNLKIDGAHNSQHKLGRAADIVTGVAPRIIYTYLDHRYPDIFGIGNYSKFTHIDTRSGNRARW